MALVKRKPRKTMTCTEAARRLGYRSSVTVKRMIEAGKLQGFKMADGPTSPWFVFEKEVEAYIEKRLSRVAI